jgi:long-chain acyl-CoA synthetase
MNTTGHSNFACTISSAAASVKDAFVDASDSAHPRTFTYEQLRSTVARAAGGITRMGALPGESVTILSENRWEFVCSYYAAMWAGCVAIPINFKMSRSALQTIFSENLVALAFADEARRAAVPQGVPVVGFDGGECSFAQLCEADECAPSDPRPGDLAKVLYTSGSTGRPKGVPLEHSGQLWALDKFVSAADVSDRHLIVAPTYHKNGLLTTMTALASGATIVSMPRFDAREYLSLVVKQECDCLSGIPTMFALMLREKDLALPERFRHVKRVHLGSAPLTDALLKEVQRLFPQAVVSNGYGSTEAGPAFFGPHPQGSEPPPLALGVPWPDIDWRLVDGPDPSTGTLHVRTPALTRGYLNLPEVTASRFRDGWFNTGDIMRRDAQGFFFFVGRADDMFICGGENIYPNEIEKLLERHPEIAQAAVVAKTDEIKGQIPVAFVVRTFGAAVSEDQVKRYALSEGPAYQHPRRVVFKDALPLAGPGKIDRNALTEEAARLARNS